MYAEIDGILLQSDVSSQVDEVAAVAYLTWDERVAFFPIVFKLLMYFFYSNQWVSYDTDQSKHLLV